MTAFARSSVRSAGLDVVCELRSVNHRYLDVSFKLPDGGRVLESTLRERLRSRIGRGRIEVLVRVVSDARRGVIELDAGVVSALTAAIERLRDAQPHLAAPTALDVLRWPGVIVDAGSDEQPLREAVLAAVDSALDALEVDRRREGEALTQAIAARLDAIDAIIRELQPIAASLTQTLRDRLLARLEQLAVSVDAERLAQEVALAAQRGDISEEVDRLAAHVGEYRKALASREPAGRRLDFLAQEMHREANTLSSKAVTGLLSDRAVALKVQIEQVREQVQNIE